MRLVTGREMRAIEAAADAAGLSYAAMMDRAGAAVAAAVNPLADGPIVVLAGPGNNGGDGLVAARLLADEGRPVRVLVWRRRLAGDPLVAAVTRHDGVQWAHTDEADALARLGAWLADAEVVVDALLGTGADRPLTGIVADILDAVSARRDRLFVIAADLPTGLDADTGALDPHAVRADVTVTFGYPKRGHMTWTGGPVVGKLVIEGIGIPEAVGDGPAAGAVRGGPAGGGDRAHAIPPPTLEISTAATVAAVLPPRPPHAHKGTFGSVLVVGGSASFAGAPYFAGAAAYRSGCGLVTLAVPHGIQRSLVALLPEATWLPLPEADGALDAPAAADVAAAWGAYTAVVLGPGLTTRPGARAFVEALLDAAGGGRADAGASAGQRRSPPPPMVVDADALNIVAELDGGPARLPPRSVLTPHPREMARLTGIGVDDVNADRIGCARRAASAWGHVVVLKGAYTVVADPSGHTTVNPFAVPALATAGTGDVLGGVIAGLMAQALDGHTAAVAATHLHALAGEIAAGFAGARGVMAGDVLAAVAGALEELEG